MATVARERAGRAIHPQLKHEQIGQRLRHGPTLAELGREPNVYRWVIRRSKQLVDGMGVAAVAADYDIGPATAYGIRASSVRQDR